MTNYKSIASFIGVWGLIIILVGWLTFVNFDHSYVTLIVGGCILGISLLAYIIYCYENNRIIPEVPV
jgi:CHASE2 domain-containing sensor protein